MVGGIVREVFRFDGKIALLIQGSAAEDKHQFLAVDLADTSDVIAPGDSVWWQSNLLMWNPKHGRWTDKQLERSGYTYSADLFWGKAAALAKQGICMICESTNCMHDGEGALYCNDCGASYLLSDVPGVK